MATDEKIKEWYRVWSKDSVLKKVTFTEYVKMKHQQDMLLMEYALRP